MTREQIEAAVRTVLADESTALGISDKLFTPDGLFSRLASNEAERKAMVKTPLFQQAQKRFRELQFKEAEAFQTATANMQDANVGNEYAFKLERVAK